MKKNHCQTKYVVVRNYQCLVNFVVIVVKNSFIVKVYNFQKLCQKNSVVTVVRH